jgi:hypothetical protein
MSYGAGTADYFTNNFVWELSKYLSSISGRKQQQQHLMQEWEQVLKR